MLKKANRLAKSRDIQKTIARGRAFFSPFLSVKFLSSATSPRFTVVVSTKVSKKAVERNRIKRILREVVRKSLQNFKNGDYMVFVKPKAMSLKEPQLLSDFKVLANKFNK